MSDKPQTTFCPECACLKCRVATFNRKYDELRNLALQYANHHPASEANIGAAIGSMRQFPQNIGVQAIELLDQFHDLLWRKYDRP